MKNRFASILFLILCMPIHAYNMSTRQLADSLKALLAAYHSDLDKAKAIDSIYFSKPTNSALKEVCIDYFKQNFSHNFTLEISTRRQFYEGEDNLKNGLKEQAIKNYLSYLKYDQSNNQILAHIYYQIGRIYLIQAYKTAFIPEAHFLSAYEFFAKSLTLKTNMESEVVYTSHLLLICHSLIEMGHYHLAKQYLKALLKYAEQNGEYDNHYACIGLLAQIEQENKNHEKAINHLNNSIQYLEKGHILQVDILYNLGRNYLALNQIDTAIQLALEGYGFVEQTKDYRRKRNLTQVISDGYRAQENFELALKYQKIYRENYDLYLRQVNEERQTPNLSQFINPNFFNSAKIMEDKQALAQKLSIQNLILRTLLISIGFITLFVFFILANIRILSSTNEKLNEKIDLIGQKNRKINEQKDIIQTQSIHLKESNKNKDQLFKNLSASLKNSIGSFEQILSALIIQGSTPKELNYEALKIKRQTANVSQDLNNLLQLSYTKFNKEGFIKESVNLKSLTECAISEIEHLFHINKLTYKVNLREDLNAFIIPDQVKEVLKYLITIEIIYAAEQDQILIGYCGIDPDNHKLVIKNKAKNQAGRCTPIQLEELETDPGQLESRMPKAIICQEVMLQNKGKIILLEDTNIQKWYVSMPRYDETKALLRGNQQQYIQNHFDLIK